MRFWIFIIILFVSASFTFAQENETSVSIACRNATQTFQFECATIGPKVQFSVGEINNPYTTERIQNPNETLCGFEFSERHRIFGSVRSDTHLMEVYTSTFEEAEEHQNTLQVDLKLAVIDGTPPKKTRYLFDLERDCKIK